MLTPRAIINRRREIGSRRTLYLVNIMWKGEKLDRPVSEGISCGYDGELARRLAKAVDSGAVFSDPKVCVDINGRSYVSANSRVYTRQLSKSLSELGF